MIPTDSAEVPDLGPKTVVADRFDDHHPTQEMSALDRGKLQEKRIEAAVREVQKEVEVPVPTAELSFREAKPRPVAPLELVEVDSDSSAPDNRTRFEAPSERRMPVSDSEHVRSIVSFLTRHSALKALPLHELRAVFARMHAIDVPVGRAVYERADASGNVYLFEAGELDVERTDHAGGLSRRKARVGELFGLRASVQGSPHEESLWVVDDARLFSISAEAVADLRRDLDGFRGFVEEVIRGDLERSPEVDSSRAPAGRKSLAPGSRPTQPSSPALEPPPKARSLSVTIAILMLVAAALGVLRYLSS
ncbi:MAG: Crp/Fnr family transcriptional regulator [Deltaproteobacteria bacterium]|nr:Crp/Fnr family transcriptional regulator [Deltaproteobacteria bacterium]